MVDMDRLAAQEYSPEVIVSISESLSRLQRSYPILPLDVKTAEDIVAEARTGSVGVPQLIRNAMQEVKEHV